MTAMSEKIDVNAIKREIGVENLMPLPRDVSPREYFRSKKNGQKFILMLYPEASEKNREELQNFIEIGAWLDSQGIKSADLIDANTDHCYALFEDLGEVSFGKALRENPNKHEDLYAIATEVLCVLRDVKPLARPYYYESRVHENRRQFVEYYMPLNRKKPSDDEVLNRFLKIWNNIEKSLPPCPQGFVHGDFHLENLIYRPEDNGIKKCALIDYQDALTGPLPYDLMNLLEDARMTVPDHIKQKAINTYCQNMTREEKQNFMSWYRVLSAQFHGRVLGLFIKLSAEQGRESYLEHIPRLQNYMIQSLSDPLLEPMKTWLEKEGVDFTPIKDLHGDQIRKQFDSL